MTQTPLDPDLRRRYQLAVGQTDREDVTGRVEAARRLAIDAFRQQERASWEATQLLEWRLMRRSNLRPTHPADVAVLSAVYAIEEENIELPELPSELSPADFCKLLAKEVQAYSASDSGLVQLMLGGELSPEDWKYFGYQWLPASIDFTRQIALSSIPLPREAAYVLYQNLFDESGRGDVSASHFVQLCKFLHPLGVDSESEAVLLDWVEPTVLAMTNAQNRMLFKTEPGWGLGSLFLSETLVPGELSKVREALFNGAVVETDNLVFFDEHVELDVEHGHQWLGVIEDLIRDPIDQRVTLCAALQRGRTQRAAWDAALAGWKSWRATGIRPHLPVAALEAQ